MGAKIMKYEIVPIEKLKPLEKVFPHHLENLRKMILKDNMIKLPLLADKKTGIVLDGSHRYVFFLTEGYKTVPVRFVDYDNEDIRVGTHLMHKHIIYGSTNISKAEVKERGLTGNLYPPRTTRHFFPFRKTDIVNIPLSDLKKGEPVDVKKLIADVDVQEEIDHNLHYISEIDAETEEIARYLDEAKQTKTYLKKQIEQMEKEKK